MHFKQKKIRNKKFHFFIHLLVIRYLISSSKLLWRQKKINFDESCYIAADMLYVVQVYVEKISNYQQKTNSMKLFKTKKNYAKKSIKNDLLPG